MRRSRRSLRGLLAAALLALGALGCGAPGPTELPLGPVKDADMSLTANNQSDRTLELFVNGGKVADVAAKTQVTIQAVDLQPLPWAAELRLPTGRALVTLTVKSGDVVRTESGIGGLGARADLSCGRVELYPVIPLGGPAPGPGRPGDCGP